MLTSEERQILIDHKDLITSRDYKSLFDIFLDKRDEGDNFKIAYDLINFIYNECNINFLKYFPKYSNAEPYIALIETPILIIPDNVYKQDLSINVGVNTVIFEVDRVTNQVELNSTTSDLRTVYITSKYPTSVQIEVFRSSWRNEFAKASSKIKELVLGSNIIAADFGNDSFNPVKVSHPDFKIVIEQAGRTGKFKVLSGIQDASGNRLTDFIKYVDNYPLAINESFSNLKEAYSSSIPSWLEKWVKNKTIARLLSGAGIDISSANFIEIDPQTLKLNQEKRIKDPNICFYNLQYDDEYGYPVEIIYCPAINGNDIVPYDFAQQIERLTGQRNKAQYLNQLPQKILKRFCINFCYTQKDPKILDKFNSRLDNNVSELDNFYDGKIRVNQLQRDKKHDILEKITDIIDKSGYIIQDIDKKASNLLKNADDAKISRVVTSRFQSVSKQFKDYINQSDISMATLDHVKNVVKSYNSLLTDYRSVMGSLIQTDYTIYEYKDRYDAVNKFFDHLNKVKAAIKVYEL